MDDSSKRFGIARFLALFLLDRVGRLAASDLRGERPEAEVRRLLNLEGRAADR